MRKQAADIIKEENSGDLPGAKLWPGKSPDPRPASPESSSKSGFLPLLMPGHRHGTTHGNRRIR